MTAAAGSVLRADAVVVGSGAGGAPAAARLAEAGFEVLVLEAGPRLSAADFSADEAAMTARLGRTTATASGAQNLYAGACVGGSTVVNDALCWRTPSEVLERWRREHGLSDLTDAAFAPFVDSVWREIHAETTPPSHLNRNARRLALGASRLGWSGEAMARNVRGCARLGRCNWGCPTNAKQSALVSWLPRAERAGARVLPNAPVTRVLVSAGAVDGVEALQPDPGGGKPTLLRIDAPRVLLAAGVLETPALLLRSGLTARGAVGRGLQFHSSAIATARFAEPVHGYFGPTMSYAITEFSDVNGHAGPGFMLENTAVHPVVTATSLPGFGAEHERVMQALPQLARAVVVLRDETRGRVAIDAKGRARYEHALARPTSSACAARCASSRAPTSPPMRCEVLLPVHGLAPIRSEGDLARLDAAPLDPTRFSFLYAVHLFGGACAGRIARDLRPAGPTASSGTCAGST